MKTTRMLAWDDSMSTGLPQLDAQHQELFARYNRLSEALERGGGASREATGELLDFLQFYTAWHFEREEECMEQYQCPVAEANKKAHAYFVDIFSEFYALWQESDTDLEVIWKTYTELGNWLINHIQRIDTQLLPCMNK